DSLRQGIANLVANAVKHGDGDNSVTVAIESRNGEVVISVSDRGPGIHPSDLPHVFDAFYRGKDTREHQVPGSGLGLSLVQHIARDHGGRIEVESNPGKGSRFSLILPEAPRAV
ncbi:MAG: sensor histidine kinase, partial [Vicinamibacteria bacterium]